MYTVDGRKVYFDGKLIHKSKSEGRAKKLCKQLSSGSGFNLHVPDFFFTFCRE